MRYFIALSYDGRGFHGSQIQGNTPTVQFALNKSLSTLLRNNIETFGASRTDEGVHALCNFYHFDLDEDLPVHFLYKLNALLPRESAARAVYRAVDPNLNARFDAFSRTYRYKIYWRKDPFKYGRALFYPYPTNTQLLQQTAELILKHSNFEAFSKRNTQTFTFNCQIMQSRWEVYEDELHYVVEANRFLRGMVRGLVGTQLRLMRQEQPLERLSKIFESKDCCNADFSVSGNGLYLENIKYPENALLPLI